MFVILSRWHNKSVTLHGNKVTAVDSTFILLTHELFFLANDSGLLSKKNHIDKQGRWADGLDGGISYLCSSFHAEERNWLITVQSIASLTRNDAVQTLNKTQPTYCFFWFTANSFYQIYFYARTRNFEWSTDYSLPAAPGFPLTPGTLVSFSSLSGWNVYALAL